MGSRLSPFSPCETDVNLYWGDGKCMLRTWDGQQISFYADGKVEVLLSFFPFSLPCFPSYYFLVLLSLFPIFFLFCLFAFLRLLFVKERRERPRPESNLNMPLDEDSHFYHSMRMTLFPFFFSFLLRSLPNSLCFLSHQTTYLCICMYTLPNIENRATIYHILYM